MHLLNLDVWCVCSASAIISMLVIWLNLGFYDFFLAKLLRISKCLLLYGSRILGSCHEFRCSLNMALDKGWLLFKRILFDYYRFHVVRYNSSVIKIEPVNSLTFIQVMMYMMMIMMMHFYFGMMLARVTMIVILRLFDLSFFLFLLCSLSLLERGVRMTRFFRYTAAIRAWTRRFR